jgi:hypothetical protein
MHVYWQSTATPRRVLADGQTRTIHNPGDTVAVVEAHYAPYVKVLRERTRCIIESSERIEKPLPIAQFLHTRQRSRAACNEKYDS